MKVISNTLVKNGMPFIVPVLEQVLPYMYKCVVTLSESSDDGTQQALLDLKTNYPNEIDIAYENVSKAGYLTLERKKMIDRSQEADWILFLDDDDYWPTVELERMLELITYADKGIDGFSVTPYDVLDGNHHDWNWHVKSFTKWFRNNDINYQGAWPRDLVFTGKKPLYWKHTSDVVKLPGRRFYHLAHMKNYSFRNDNWAQEHAFKDTEPVRFDPAEQKIVDEIMVRGRDA